MQIMQSTIRLLNVVGINLRNTRESNELTNYVIRIVTIVVLVVNPYPQFTFLLLNTDDIIKVAFSIYYIVVGFGILVQYAILVWKGEELRELLQTIECVVNKKISLNGFENFVKTKNFLDTTLSLSQKATWVIYSIYVSSPMLIILYAYLMGTLTNDHFVAPLGDMYYFFDATHSPLFEICYIINMAKLAFAVMIFIAVDIMFVELCFYILAMYDELKQMLAHLNRVESYQVTSNLRGCIVFHTEIIDISERASKIIDHIVATKLSYSFLTLATNTFTALYVDPKEYPKMISSCGCFVSELFVYCYLGSRVLDEADEVQYNVYGLPWFDYRRREKSLIQTIMIHTSYSKSGFSAFKYIYVNIETIGMMMSKVYSALAFLQNFI